MNIIAGLQLFILYRYGWDRKRLWESYIVVASGKQTPPITINVNTIEDNLLGIHELDERWLFGVLDILGACSIVMPDGSKKEAEALGIYGWKGTNIDKLTNLYAVMQNTTSQTTYKCLTELPDTKTSCPPDKVIPYMCIRPAADVQKVMVRNAINNATQSLTSLFRQAEINAEAKGIPYRQNILSKAALSNSSVAQVYSVLCPDQSIQDKMLQCALGAASGARARFVRTQFFKLGGESTIGC